MAELVVLRFGVTAVIDECAYQQSLQQFMLPPGTGVICGLAKQLYNNISRPFTSAVGHFFLLFYFAAEVVMPGVMSTIFILG